MIPHALTSGVSPVDPSGVYDSQVFALPSGLPSAVHLQMPQQRPFRLSSISEFEGPGPAVMSMHEQPIPQPMMAASFPSMGFSNPFMNPSEGFGVSDAADPQRKRKGLKPAQGAKRRNSMGTNPPENLKVRRKMRKNNREKQRRSELNEKFEQLCILLNLGRNSKAEKLTILTEAVNLLHSLKIENNELKVQTKELRNELSKLTHFIQHFPPDARFRFTGQDPKDMDSLSQSHPEDGSAPVIGIESPTDGSGLRTPGQSQTKIFVDGSLQVPFAHKVPKGPFAMSGAPTAPMVDDLDIFQ